MNVVGHLKISSQKINDPPHGTQNVIIQLQEVYETCNLVSGGVETLNDDLQRLATESAHYQNTLNPLTQDLSILKISIQEQNAFLDGIKTNQDLLQQEIASTEQKMNDMKTSSYEGTLIWKVTDVQEKMGQQLFIIFKIKNLRSPCN
jgi:chromosome segregation ATPase